MADTSSDNWSDRDKPKAPQGKSKKSGGPDDLMRIMFPISNLASLKRGGKVQKKTKRMKARD